MSIIFFNTGKKYVAHIVDEIFPIFILKNSFTQENIVLPLPLRKTSVYTSFISKNTTVSDVEY